MERVMTKDAEQIYAAHEGIPAAELAATVARYGKALKRAREAIASLDEFALGGADIPDTHTGEAVGRYGFRDELLAEIDAALSPEGH